MPIAEWPDTVNHKPDPSTWRRQPLDKIRTEFDGANIRKRGRPGDAGVRDVDQVVSVPRAAFTATLEPFLDANENRKIIMPVWNGSAYVRSAVQILAWSHENKGADRTLVTLSLRVYRAVLELTIEGTPVLTATEDVFYAGFQAEAAGGVPGYVYSIEDGTLPAGIALNADTGVLSGTPTETGTFADIVIRVTDAAGETADLDPFTLTVS